ncbi:ATP-dependent helicase C-terminal [Trinorchestia longiramus]|nr:ATP-dependent helicase C-terminal [Trinorchestia longiramus]
MRFACACFLNATEVLEEPREASAVAALLSDYSAAIRRAETASGGCTGAMLFCVVGGKMSEGINFSDSLGRCVVMVGMPFPNTQSIELKERMKHLDTTRSGASQQTKNCGERSGGAEYYHNLCFRAVNQSIGRAIRHREDYACMLLLDQRYSRPSSISALPAWISRSLILAEKYHVAHAAVAKFFARHKRNREQ